MAAQARCVGEMSVEELRRLIAEEVRSQLEHYDTLDAGETRQAELAAARRYIEDHRFTLPPGSPTVEELVRQERDSNPGKYPAL